MNRKFIWLIISASWLVVPRIGVISQVSQQVMTSPALGDRYTRGCLTGSSRVFSLFMALTYAMTS
ncbi:hypothetical protein, partial [Aeromonas enteropelogenes]|uniref:hypothetical protein n=1 Tax=Aeromonas enteropelogenes TaxID=29489 RepID=UPI003F742CD5